MIPTSSRSSARAPAATTRSSIGSARSTTKTCSSASWSIGEIERGIERIRKRDPKSATRLRRWLSNLSHHSSTDRILPVTLPIARAWGKMGAPNPIPTIDGLLAATAHVHGLVLATRNVTHVESLDIEWVNPFNASG